MLSVLSDTAVVSLRDFVLQYRHLLVAKFEHRKRLVQRVAQRVSVALHTFHQDIQLLHIFSVLSLEEYGSISDLVQIVSILDGVVFNVLVVSDYRGYQRVVLVFHWVPFNHRVAQLQQRLHISDLVFVQLHVQRFH